MFLIHLSVSVIISLPISSSVPAQEPSAATQASQRDQGAVSSLQQALNATGGTKQLSAVKDFAGTGTITYHWAGEDVPGSVTVYGKGLGQFRMDANLPGGIQSLIIDGNAGTFSALNGQKMKLNFHSIMTAGALTLPSLRIAAALNDTSTRLNYFGLVVWENSQAIKVHVAPPVDPALTIDSRLKGLGEFDLYFDPTSYRLLELDEGIWWGGDLTQTYTHQILFSNYVSTGGLSVPFSITERFGGQETWSLSLTSVTFNNGLSDSLFSL